MAHALRNAAEQSRSDRLEDLLALAVALLAEERGISIEQVRDRLWKAPPPPPRSPAVVPAGGPKLLRLKAVKEKIGFSASTIYRWVAAGSFPRPLRIGFGSAWRESDIDAWIAERQR